MSSYSDGTGSLTLRIMSAWRHTSSAEPTNSAPARLYRSPCSDEPSPAPSWTSTWWPAAVSSRAPSGVSATRYSLSLTSLGTPTITVWPFPRPGCGKRTRPGDDAGVASDRLDRAHEPGARHALELVFPALGEHDARTGDEIGHRA